MARVVVRLVARLVAVMVAVALVADVEVVVARLVEWLVVRSA